ncbi:hypothetical protein F8M41_013554 [Gigaspora margarita]|uniref:Uncharacterized protein n=1 Tax=Gigaspora margarita TaxID=4874 RepID=A0A8H3WZP1_GIGMA|nr:hypothetical protein F8M41_013554 [Gigaspora margarita]
MKSQQGRHIYEQNNDYDIDSYTKESEEEPEKLSENEINESENQNGKGDSDSYENNLMDIDESEVDNIEDISKNKNSVKNKNNTLSENTVLLICNISFEAIEEGLSDMSVVLVQF